MGLRRADVFPSRYLGKDDLEHPVRVTIADVRMETIKGDHGDDDKPILLFNNGEKPMILNSTNWDALEAGYGPDTDQWIGKPAELYIDPGVMYAGRRVGGVRVRIPSAPARTATVPFAQILLEASEVGMSREDMVAALKATGLASYNSARDGAVARQIIADKRQPSAADAFSDEAAEGEEAIPF